MATTLEQFESYLTFKHLSERTVSNYVSRLSRILKDCDPITEDNFKRFIVQLRRDGCTNNTCNVYVKTIRHYGICFEVDALKRFPMLSKNATVKATMSEGEIDRFLSLTARENTTKRWYHRWEMWTVFFYCVAYTGARTREIAELTVDDVNQANHTLTINATKTNTVRMVPIVPALQSVLYGYIKTLDREKLFTGCHGQSWGRQFHTRLKTLGIKRKGLTPYSLRRSYISRMADEVNIFDLKNLVGHKDVKTTEQYYVTSTKRLKRAAMRDPLNQSSMNGKDKLQMIKQWFDQLNLYEDNDLNVSIQLNEEELEIRVKVKKQKTTRHS